MNDGDKLTRMYLLASHSRGWMDEMAEEGSLSDLQEEDFHSRTFNPAEAQVKVTDEAGEPYTSLWQSEDMAGPADRSEVAAWQGRQKTHSMFRRSYE